MNATSPERSEAVTVPIAVWFSSMLKVAGDEKTGAVVSLTLTVLFAHCRIHQLNLALQMTP